MDVPLNIPIPDPSLLTGEALDRLRADLHEQIDCVEKTLLERIDREREALEAVKELLNVKIEGHWRLDTERFSAQKEAAAAQNTANTIAIGKSEEATKEALSKQEASANASRSALSDRIDVVRESVNNLDRTLSSRISDVSSATSNLGATRQGGQQASAFTLSLLMLIATVIGLAVAVAVKL